MVLVIFLIPDLPTRKHCSSIMSNYGLLWLNIYFYVCYPSSVPISTYPLWSSVSESVSSSNATSITTATTLAPSRSIPSCSHHHRVTHVPGCRYATIHGSNIRRFTLYGYMVLLRKRVDVSTSSRLSPDIAASKYGYFHLTIVSCRTFVPARQQARSPIQTRGMSGWPDF